MVRSWAGFALGIWSRSSLSLDKGELFQDRSVRPPVLHDLLPRLLPQISDRELCWLHAEMPEWAAWLPQGPKW